MFFTFHVYSLGLVQADLFLFFSSRKKFSAMSEKNFFSSSLVTQFLNETLTFLIKLMHLYLSLAFTSCL